MITGVACAVIPLRASLIAKDPETWKPLVFAHDVGARAVTAQGRAHMPSPQTPDSQTLPQLPPFLGSLFVSTHVPLQQVADLGQHSAPQQRGVCLGQRFVPHCTWSSLQRLHCHLGGPRTHELPVGNTSSCHTTPAANHHLLFSDY